MALPSYAMNQQSFPAMYERWLVAPLFRPFAEAIIGEMRITPSDRLLDIACGTGIVARVGRERLGDGGKIVGVDISTDMLAVARAVAPDIEWREGNASELPLRDAEQFDVVVCHQGLQFFPDKAAAVRQMRGALRQGGRLAVATWRSDEESPFLYELRRVAERHLGAIADQRYNFDGGQLATLLGDAGFHDVHASTITRAIRFEPDAPYLPLNAMALVGMSAAGKGMAKAQRKRLVDAIVSDSAPVLGNYSDAKGFSFSLSTNLATAKG